MNNKGFTLVELLVIIIILGVIALIAVPKVVDLIDTAEEDTAKRSAEKYEDTVQAKILSLRGKENEITDGVYSVKELEAKGVKYSGKKLENGVVAVEDGKVMALIGLEFDDYIVSIKGEKINSTTEPICVASKTLTNSGAGSIATSTSDQYNLGIEYKCDPGDGKTRTFYVFEVTDDKVYLILDRNLSASIGFSSETDKKTLDGPVLPLKQLKEKTASWSKVYVTLPTGYQMAEHLGITKYTEGYDGSFDLTSYKYLYTNIPTSDSGCSSITNCTDDSSKVPILRGYYTSTILSWGNWQVFKISYWSGKTTFGYGSDRLTNGNFHLGVRPVIAIPKNQLSLN